MNAARDGATPAPRPCVDASIWTSIADPHALRAAGMFVAEGRMVVDRLLIRAASAAFDVVRVLATPAAVRALGLDERVPDLLDVRTPHEMQEVTGFNFHRGVLAVARRPPLTPVLDLVRALPGDGPLVVAEHIVDVDNVGSIFRNACALGAAAVLLDDTSADPLYRKAVRTSMGAVLDLRWTTAGAREVWDALRSADYRLLALTPERTATPLRAAMASARHGRVAIVVGNEGEGLSADALAACDVRVRIPMADGADSLNVATALAVALYEAGEHRR